MFGLTAGERDSSGIVVNDCLGLDIVGHLIAEALDENATLATMFGERIGYYTHRPALYMGTLPALFVYPFFSDPLYVPGTAEAARYLFVTGIGFPTPANNLQFLEPSPLTAAAMVKQVLWTKKELNDTVNDTPTRMLQGFEVQRENQVFAETVGGRKDMVIHEVPWLVRVRLNPATGQIQEVEANSA